MFTLSKKNNIVDTVNAARRNKIINIFLIISMLSHITYLHDLLEGYVLCYGSDGHIAIENINDCTDCNRISNFELRTKRVSSVFHADNCNDVGLNSNCFEDDQFLSNKANLFSLNNNVCIEFIYNPTIKSGLANTKFYLNSYNPILDNYTTVSLLI